MDVRSNSTVRYVRKPNYHETTDQSCNVSTADVSVASEMTIPEYYDTLPSMRNQSRDVDSRNSSRRQSWTEMMASEEHLTHAANMSLVSSCNPPGQRRRNSQLSSLETSNNPLKLISMNMLRRNHTQAPCSQQDTAHPFANSFAARLNPLESPDPILAESPLPRTASRVSSRDSAISTLNEFVLLPTKPREAKNRQTGPSRRSKLQGYIRSHYSTKRLMVFLGIIVAMFVIAGIAVIARKYSNLPKTERKSIHISNDTKEDNSAEKMQMIHDKSSKAIEGAVFKIFHYTLKSGGNMTIKTAESQITFALLEQHGIQWRSVRALADFNKNFIVYGGNFKDTGVPGPRTTRVCFVMELNRTALPSPEKVRQAADMTPTDNTRTIIFPVQYNWNPVEIKLDSEKKSYLRDDSMKHLCNNLPLYFLKVVDRKPDNCVCQTICIPHFAIVNFTNNQRILTFPNLICVLIRADTEIVT